MRTDNEIIIDALKARIKEQYDVIHKHLLDNFQPIERVSYQRGQLNSYTYVTELLEEMRSKLIRNPFNIDTIFNTKTNNKDPYHE